MCTGGRQRQQRQFGEVLAVAPRGVQPGLARLVHHAGTAPGPAVTGSPATEVVPGVGLTTAAAVAPEVVDKDPRRTYGGPTSTYLSQRHRATVARPGPERPGPVVTRGEDQVGQRTVYPIWHLGLSEGPKAVVISSPPQRAQARAHQRLM
jgi:hypothetical protein